MECNRPLHGIIYSKPYGRWSFADLAERAKKKEMLRWLNRFSRSHIQKNRKQLVVFAFDYIGHMINLDGVYEIADLDFRIDSLTHPVTGQVSVMLRAPDGTGSDLIWRRGGLMSPNQGVAADLIGVNIDDDLLLTLAEDLNQSTVAEAPFTGDWLPAGNSPFWDGYATTPAVQAELRARIQSCWPATTP